MLHEDQFLTFNFLKFDLKIENIFNSTYHSNNGNKKFHEEFLSMQQLKLLLDRILNPPGNQIYFVG